MPNIKEIAHKSGFTVIRPEQENGFIRLLTKFAELYFKARCAELSGSVYQIQNNDDPSWVDVDHELYTHVKTYKANPFRIVYLAPQAMSQDVADYKEALQKIVKGVNKPMPDPNIHGWEVFARAAMALATDYKFIAIKALANKPAGSQ